MLTGSMTDADLIGLRRTLHSNPELSRQEFRTSQLVMQRLQAADLQPRLMGPGTGVVCDIGSTGPLMAIRADLDALPIQDLTNQPYSSKVPGVAHACGHDVHTTVLVGTALALAKNPPEYGRVRFIFQPAEEANPSGSLDAIQDGVLREVRAIYALHCDPSAAVGRIGIRTGALTSAYDYVGLTAIKSDGIGPNHHHGKRGTRPDLIKIVADVITEFPTELRFMQGHETREAVVFGTFTSSGDDDNDPDSVHAAGTIRCPDVEYWDKLPQFVERFMASRIEPHGIKWKLRYDRVCPIVNNDPQTTNIAARAAKSEFGESAVYEPPQSVGGEDFAWYTQHVAGTLVRLGVRGDMSNEADLHSGSFDVDERAIAVGIRLWLSVIREQLSQFAASELS